VSEFYSTANIHIEHLCTGYHSHTARLHHNTQSNKQPRYPAVAEQHATFAVFCPAVTTYV